MDLKLKVFMVFLGVSLIIRLIIFYGTKVNLKIGNFEFESTLMSQPKIYNSYQTFTLNTKDKVRILVKTDPENNFSYGDRLKIAGNLNKRLLENGSYYYMDFPKISFVKTNMPLFLAVGLFIRQNIINNFDKFLPSDYSALLLGIVFGIKQNMSYDFSNKLKQVGVMHVIAASGMNIAMVSGFIFYVFSVFIKRQLAVILSVLAILFYAFLAGFEPSIIRASIMGIIAFTAQGLGRQNYGFYSLILTGFVMLFVSPIFLEDIGFQLSFLSTLGILFIPKVFGKYTSLLSEDLLTTISAQMATLPIILLNFGTYSIWSVLANVCLLWTIPILMILGGVASLFGFIFLPLSKVVLYFTIPILSFFEAVVSFFSKFQGVSADSFPWQFGISYYCFLLLIILLRTKRKSISLPLKKQRPEANDL